MNWSLNLSLSLVDLVVDREPPAAAEDRAAAEAVVPVAASKSSWMDSRASSISAAASLSDSSSAANSVFSLSEHVAVVSEISVAYVRTIVAAGDCFTTVTTEI